MAEILHDPTLDAPTHIPITDVPAWLEGQHYSARGVFTALAELLAGVAATDSDEDENAERFTKRCLGPVAQLVVEDDPLTPASAVATALAVAELIAEHDPEIGPAMHADAPSWTTTQIGGDRLRHPLALRAYFPAGSIADQDCIIVLYARPNNGRPTVTALARPEHQDGARAVLDRLSARAAELNPHRGRVLRAGIAGGLTLEVITLPATLSRSTVVVPPQVWDEVDLGVRAVRDEYALLNRHGLGVRRGVLLVGPPGTGKSAVSAVVAQELHADGFTVVYVEAKAGTMLLTVVIEELQRWGGPVLLVLEDVDLWCRDRSHSGGGGLSELLQAMDIDPESRILTLASTNDAGVLDAAAIRTGRFDAILEVPYPDRGAAAAILAALLGGIPGGDGVDTAAVAAALPERTSGSDIREIVRRAVLGGGVSTDALLAEVGAGRYRAELPGGVGAYL
jgi:cell division protease FtsH